MLCLNFCLVAQVALEENVSPQAMAAAPQDAEGIARVNQIKIEFVVKVEGAKAMRYMRENCRWFYREMGGRWDRSGGAD